MLAIEAGAAGVTLRLRADRAEVQDRDVELMAVRAIRWNLRIGPSNELLGIAQRLAPPQCCLVPEQRHEHAPGGGLDVTRLQPQLAGAVAALRSANIEVAARIDPTLEQVDACVRAGFAACELDCGAYALTGAGVGRSKRLASLSAAANAATYAGLAAYAGGGLDYDNVAPLVLAVDAISELRIGQAILARALELGLARALAQLQQHAQSPEAIA